MAQKKRKDRCRRVKVSQFEHLDHLVADTANAKSGACALAVKEHIACGYAHGLGIEHARAKHARV